MYLHNMQLGRCPRCAHELTHERVFGSTIICECGWSKSMHSDQADRRNMDRTCASIVLVSGLLIASFLQAVNWDRHFFAIIPLKVKQVAGKATIKELEQIVEICNERKKIDCSERALSQIARKQPTNLPNLSRLGQLQFKRGSYERAVSTLTLYFSQRGTDVDAAYTYAQALTRLKKYDQADRFYKFALEQKPEILQITVVRSYVQMLVEADRLKQARDTILQYRRQSTNANFFMSKELADIRAKVPGA
jgi:tetratricopeptide (TPR) repeat protein